MIEIPAAASRIQHDERPVSQCSPDDAADGAAHRTLVVPVGERVAADLSVQTLKKYLGKEHYKVKLELCNGCKKCAEACPCGFIEMQ